jgi:small GTP-binding protein
MTLLQRKIMLLGDIGVGKTSIARRLVFDRFETSYKTTIGVDILTHDLELVESGVRMRFVIWDTDGDFGQEIFNEAYIRGASAAVVVSDLTRPGTIAKMEALVATFSERFPGRPLAALLNKSDLAPGETAAKELAHVADLVHVTSAFSGDGIAKVFLDLAEMMTRRNV